MFFKNYYYKNIIKGYKDGNLENDQGFFSIDILKGTQKILSSRINECFVVGENFYYRQCDQDGLWSINSNDTFKRIENRLNSEHKYL